jgi:hypothetical protein
VLNANDLKAREFVPLVELQVALSALSAFPTQCVIYPLCEPLALVLDIPDRFFHCQADKRQPAFAVCGKGTVPRQRFLFAWREF